MPRYFAFLAAAVLAAVLCAVPLRTHAQGAGYLFVADWGGDKVLRYDGTTGASVDTFVPKHTGGLNQPYGIALSPHD